MISYNDFKHMVDIAYLYLNGNFDVNREEWGEGDYYEKRVTGEAMNSAMVISYMRPFSGNDKSATEKIPDLPGRYLRLLNDNGTHVHEKAIKARNNRVAHSDSEVWKMVPHILALDEDGRMVAPVHNDTLRPFSREEIQTLMSNCEIFMKEIIDERKKLETQLDKFFPELSVMEKENG